MADHPGIIFKDGPAAAPPWPTAPISGRSSGFSKRFDDRGPAALDAAAEAFAADPGRIATAVSYYGEYPGEIDAEISAADEASLRAEQAWRVRQQLIA